MIPIAAEDLPRNTMRLRHAVSHGGEVALTFRGRQYGTVVPANQLEAEREELERLRRHVAELERQLWEVALT